MKSLFVNRMNALFSYRKYVSTRIFYSNWTSSQIENEDINETNLHIPVMPKEVVESLCPQNNQVFIDMTFGAGGHSRLLLNAASIKLFCLDRDPFAYEEAKKLAKESSGMVTPLLGRFSELQTLLTEVGVKKNSVDGIFIDAGCSSMQMDMGERGFAISKDGPLDMRMDGNRFPNQATAADVINTLDVPSLARIFKIYGEEKHARKIAEAVYDARYMLKSINTTHELADVIRSTMGSAKRVDKLQRPVHVATKVFQALRIFVNNELNELNYAFEMAYAYLKTGGKVAALTFHSLEDRIVKRQLLGIDLDEPVTQTAAQKVKNAATFYPLPEINQLLFKRWKPLHKHVLTPTEKEVRLNPRSRSAKLRIAEKVEENVPDSICN